MDAEGGSRMSLDVDLYLPGASKEGSGIFIRENGAIREIPRAEWNERFPDREPIVATNDDDDAIYSANITHNLSQMADEASIYKALWRPDEIGITHAHQLIEPLKTGLKRLQQEPEHFKQFNPENGWGDYEGLVEFVEKYLEACEKYPTARVSVWR